MSTSQLKALLIKNCNLITKQKSTIICQIITPVLCLSFVFLIQFLIKMNINNTRFGLKMDFPYIFNLPIYQSIHKNYKLPISFDNCDEWYLYDFEDGIPEQDKEYFGYNEGELPNEVIKHIDEIYNLDKYKNLAKNSGKHTDLNKKLLNSILYNSYYSGLNKDTSINSFFYSIKSKPFRSNSKGILSSQSNIIQSACDKTLKMSPYFKKTEYKGNNRLNNDLYYRLKALNQLDLLLLNNELGINILPDGAVTIKKSNSKSFEYKLQINDNRFQLYHKSNGVTKYKIKSGQSKHYTPYLSITNGSLWLADLLNKAYIKTIHPELYIVSGIQLMPFELNNDDNISRLINLAGATFYPLAISLLMPLFMYTIVLEKESKLVEIMKINGMKMTYYWLSLLVFDYGIYFCTFIMYFIFGAYIYSFGLFYQTSYLLQFIIYIGWGFCQIGLAFFLQAFLSNARTSTIIGYIFSLWTTMLAVGLNITIFDIPNEMPTWMLFYPSFNICRIFYILTMECGYSVCINDISKSSPELIRCIILLYTTSLIYTILGIYLYEVIPQEFGIKKSPFFCLKFLFKNNKRNIKYLENNDNDLEINENQDPDIKLEIENIKTIINNYSTNNNAKISDETKDLSDYPLVVNLLSKVYDNSNPSEIEKQKRKKALNNFSILLKKNEIFGLLGPNGAGKTTFFSLLTGIYSPTSGDAWVSGNSILTNIDKVQQLIGYCPQFDILWSDLTVEEHLRFYSRLKNVDVSLSDIIVEETIKNTKLVPYRKFLVKELSGGMKRRLSLGISLVGNPSVVFLDEPTTGLDPENKRQIWEILSNCKEGKCMILTTHIMEEAEVLTDRIGIIINGELKCLGSKFKLKRIYGRGFKLVINTNYTISTNDNNVNEIDNNNNQNEINEDFIENDYFNNNHYNKNLIRLNSILKEKFPSISNIEKYKNSLVYIINNEEFDAEELFNVITQYKKELDIVNWAISQVSLEDIFIKLTENEIYT